MNDHLLRKIPTDLLNDLSSRFIINVPEEERIDLIRLCFQIELAHWFYLDFYCEENTKLQKVNLKDFIHIIFAHIPFLKVTSESDVDTIIADWREYKKAVPTFGGILLDKDFKNVLLVQSFVSRASWGFPKGKVNKDELPHHCAIREVLEETGFDITDLIDKDEYLEHYFNDQLIRLYIISGISSDAKFQPKTRNEIKSCQWFPLNQLPISKKDQQPKLNLFLVIPFMKQLKKWISTKISQEKATEADKQFAIQQRLFAQSAECDFMKIGNNPQLAEIKSSNPKHHKSSYSPPPRLVNRQKNAKHLSDREKKRNSPSYSQKEEKVIVNSKHNRKLNYETSNNGKIKKQPSTGSTDLISKSWQNFSLDCEALVAIFNIGLRKTSH